MALIELETPHGAKATENIREAESLLPGFEGDLADKYAFRLGRLESAYLMHVTEMQREIDRLEREIARLKGEEI